MSRDTSIREALIACLKGKVGKVVNKWRILKCVKAYLSVYNRNPYDETITREMRRMRSDGILKYTVINARKGKYKIEEVKK